MNIIAKGSKVNVNENITLPGDKSIAHRSLIIGALAEGSYEINNFPNNQDCLATLECIKKLGVKAIKNERTIYVESPGYRSFEKDFGIMDAENSGTTTRLMSGLLAGLGACGEIVGDESLSKRPMKRIQIPLESMGANIETTNDTLPLKLSSNGKLKGITYEMPVASAQVKSCVLIAGFMSEGSTKVIEKSSTRDHTERMLKYLGTNIEVNNNVIKISNSNIESKDLFVPGDISSAAFLIGCALLGENCTLLLENVLLNERRIQYIKVLKSMGAKIEITFKEKVNEEEIGDILVKSSELQGVHISSDMVPNIIDEIPVISVLAAFSKGRTVIEGIEELRYKESNRLKAIIENLQKCDTVCSAENDNLIIEGKNEYINKNLFFESYNDHRIAMAFIVSAMRNNGEIEIDNWKCTEISFPNASTYFNKFINIQ